MSLELLAKLTPELSEEGAPDGSKTVASAALHSKIPRLLPFSRIWPRLSALFERMSDGGAVRIAGGGSSAGRTTPCSVKHSDRCSRLLAAKPRSIVDLCRAMPWRGRSTLDGLGQAVENPHGALRHDFFREVLPHIIQRAAALPLHFPAGTPVIETPRAVQLPRPAVASIVASMFLGLLPPLESAEEEKRFNDRSMLGMFSSDTASSVAKTRCILHYFERLMEMEAAAAAAGFGSAGAVAAAGGAGAGSSSWGATASASGGGSATTGTAAAAAAATPQGTIVFRRVKLSPVPAYADSPAPLVPINICSVGGIDDAPDAIHTDFANMRLGGGVLRSGAVQEEIMMAVAPDSLAGLAMMPIMADDEGE